MVKLSTKLTTLLLMANGVKSLQDVRVCRGADVNSDHHLVIASIRLKLRNVMQKSQQRRHLDIAKLKCPKTNKQFVVELRNRFAALADSTNDPDINTVW